MRFPRLSCLSVGSLATVVLFFLPAHASADVLDTVLAQGIGTHVTNVFRDGPSVAIHTSISSVTYDPPVRVQRDGLVYFEVLGTVRGTGWGGSCDTLDGPGPTSSAEATYDYTVPFTLRWPERFDGTLIYYQHGYPNLGFSLLIDGVLGPDNAARHFDELESFSVLSNVLAPRRGHALFAPNLGGLTRDGDLAAFAEDGPCEGDPLNLSVDAPITRDLAVLAKRLLAKLSGSPVKRTIGIGHSGGALVLQFVTGGVTTFLFEGPNATQRAYTGDNHVSAYDPSSPIIFDGVIPLAGAAPQLAQPFTATAKVMLIGGNADYAGIEMVRYASRLLRAGVDLNATVRVYQVTNLSHNFAEIALSTPMTNAVLKDVFGVDVFADGDRLAPVVAAAVDNMTAWIAKDTPPPPSRINGLAVDTDADGKPDAIAFTQAGGLTTEMVPMADKAALDTILAEPFQVSDDPALVGRYLELLEILDHVADGLRLPSVECRVGGYEFAAETRLVPFEDLDEHWGSYSAYQRCVTGTIEELSRDGLYDKQIGVKVGVPDQIRRLFKR